MTYKQEREKRQSEFHAKLEVQNGAVNGALDIVALSWIEDVYIAFDGVWLDLTDDDGGEVTYSIDLVEMIKDVVEMQRSNHPQDRAEHHAELLKALRAAIELVELG